MTDEQMRVAIAEACPNRTWKGSGGRYWWVWAAERIAFDPLNDLNAMHEAEQTLFELDKQIQFLDAKPSRLYETNLHRIANTANAWHATARQRAQAFIATIGRK